jgi:hypothetical protein
MRLNKSFIRETFGQGTARDDEGLQRAVRLYRPLPHRGHSIWMPRKRDGPRMGMTRRIRRILKMFYMAASSRSAASPSYAEPEYRPGRHLLRIRSGR